jgi:hypothetical protein
MWCSAGAGRVHIATLQPDIRDRHTLVSALCNQLALPDGAGQSWDTLTAALRDLSWLETPTVVVFHRRAPRLPDGPLAGYLDALVRAHLDRPGRSPTLRVVFPLEAWATIDALLPPS